MPREMKSSGVKAYSLEELQAMPNTPQPIIVDSLIYENGKSVLVAKPKFGKSWLALALSIAVANGDPILGFRTRMCPVLYLDFDRRFLSATVQTLTNVHLMHPANWYIAQPTGLAINNGNDILKIEELITEIKPKLVVIDHKSACFLGKENEDEPNHRWLGNLDKLHAKYGLAYLVVCQAPKGWRGELIDLPYGGRPLTAWLDTLLSLSKNGKNFRKLERTSNYGEELEPVVYNKYFQIVTEKVDEYTKTDLAKELLAERWSECVRPHTTTVIKEIAKEIGSSLPPVWDAYTELKQEKAISEQQVQSG